MRAHCHFVKPERHDVMSSPSPPIDKSGDEGRGLLDLGKVQKEFAESKGPLWAERAGACESLVVLSCLNQRSCIFQDQQIILCQICHRSLFLQYSGNGERGL